MEDCKATKDAVAKHGEKIATLEERTADHSERFKMMETEKLDRRELEPVTWQIRSVIVAAISVMGSLILYVLTKAKL